jgi:hypothetical protein
MVSSPGAGRNGILRADAVIRRYVLVLAAILAGLLGAVSVAVPAGADPTIDEGGSATLRDQLDAASKGYLDAKVKLDASKARQDQLTSQLAAVQGSFATQSDAVQAISAAAYRLGGAGMGQLSGIVNSESPEVFLDRLSLLNVVAASQDHVVHQLAVTRDSVTQAKGAIDAEITQQQAQLADMTRRKAAAEKALRVAGGGQATSGFSATSKQALPAPRNADGSWPPESCSVNDPTTSGCITPRTLHAMNQAKAAGFTRYVSCYRSGGSGEHPKGRACDFAAAVGGFGGTATGDERTYGNNLAAYFVNNANRLGVLYVIWFRQIWLPGSGWRAYSGSGSPAADHTNHVHLSEY